MIIKEESYKQVYFTITFSFLCMKSLLIELVNQVPSARVISYGNLAEAINKRSDTTTNGWMVGRLLSSMPEYEWSQLPWWRVVNKEWVISSLKLGHKGIVQIQLLQKEWVEVSYNQVDMFKYWRKFS